MTFSTLIRTALAAALAVPLATAAIAQAGPHATKAHAAAAAQLAQVADPLPFDSVIDCYAPAGDPEPGSEAFRRRDLENQYCATVRLRDQLDSPGYGWGNLTSGARLWLDRTVEQAGDLGNPRGGFTTLIPGSQAADAYRTIERWEGAGRGTVTPVSFEALNGSTLRGHVFAPPASVVRPEGGFPGVVITDGSVQAYEELYFWAAQDLAEAGYLVMTYDVQGQGDSDLYGDDCPGACSGVPYQQSYNFYQGAEDSLSFFLGERMPFARDLDADAVGIAGHSLGASAVSVVGQCDTRVKTIVAWDNLRPVTPANCNQVTIPAEHRASTVPRIGALGIANDYQFNVQPTSTPPDPEAKQAGYEQLAAAGLDSQSISLRAGTHLEYTYIPLVLPASQKGERMASYYTRAWFDRYLKGDASGHERLTARKFDDSVDVSSIGTGRFDRVASLQNPADRYAGNIPYEIDDIPVANAVSFYYRSAYTLTDPGTGARVACADVRKGC